MSKEQLESKDYFVQYRKLHREELNEYARNYYYENPEKFREAFDKYRKTEKGKQAIERYEQSEKRMIAKRRYMVEYRARKKKRKTEERKEMKEKPNV